MLFFGKYEHSLDSKYRLRIPARLKEELMKDEPRPTKEDAPSIAKNGDGSLVIYPASTIRRIGEKIRDLGVPKEKRQKLMVFLSNIYPIDEDSQGRFTLNATLREYAGITKDVVFVGECDRIALWDRAKWQEYEANCPEDISLEEYGI
ncbi:MAG: hypothetical protein K2P12_01990 [Clostridia bacterium]|nr:hypothetical protein [Clostridia bacterium]